jgi:hypothetical protein
LQEFEYDPTLVLKALYNPLVEWCMRNDLSMRERCDIVKLAHKWKLRDMRGVFKMIDRPYGIKMQNHDEIMIYLEPMFDMFSDRTQTKKSMVQYHFKLFLQKLINDQLSMATTSAIEAKMKSLLQDFMSVLCQPDATPLMNSLCDLLLGERNDTNISQLCSTFEEANKRMSHLRGYFVPTDPPVPIYPTANN